MHYVRPWVCLVFKHCVPRKIVVGQCKEENVKKKMSTPSSLNIGTKGREREAESKFVKRYHDSEKQCLKCPWECSAPCRPLRGVTKYSYNILVRTWSNRLQLGKKHHRFSHWSGTNNTEDGHKSGYGTNQPFMDCAGEFGKRYSPHIATCYLWYHSIWMMGYFVN